MLNHAWAAAESGFEVTLVGYAETPVDRTLAEHTNVRIRPIQAAGRAPEGFPRWAVLLYSIGKGLLLSWRLGAALLSGPKPRAIVVQNPPSLPTLPVAWLACRVRGAKLWVDWHNFGHSMLALRLGAESRFVRMVRGVEYALGRRADLHTCVSNAMGKELETEAGVRAETLYDQPREILAPLPRDERVALQQRLFPGERGALIHCPTSWTADENMDLLIEALRLREAATESSGPPLEIVITGKGPLRDEYEPRLRNLELKKTRVATAFLSPEDYRLLLRAADAGLSLHTSASLVDLPMKIVDFFSAGTPVLAYRYSPTLDEQVQEGKTGWTFRDASSLARLLGERSFDENRAEVARTWRTPWTPAWRETAGRFGLL